MCEVSQLNALTKLAGAGYQMWNEWEQVREEERRLNKNIELAEMGRVDSVRRAAADAADVQAYGRSVAESAKTIVAASGVSTTAGTVPNIFTTSMANAAVDAQRIKANAAREQWGFEVEKKELRDRIRKNADKQVQRTVITGLNTTFDILGDSGSFLG